MADGLDIVLPFSTSGDAPWFNQTAVTNDGVDALQSGPIGPNQTSVLQAEVTGPVYVNFKIKTSCEGYGTDYLSYGVDGSLNYRIAGEFQWMNAGTLLVPAGTHTVTWKYQKNGSVDTGSDAIYLDQLTTTPGSLPPNDNFASRSDLGSSAPVSFTGDNRFATIEASESTFPTGSSGASVWWSWTAPGTGHAKFELLVDPVFFGIIAAYTGNSLASLNRLGWARTSSATYPPPPSAFTFPVVAGQTYQLAVHGMIFSAGQLPNMGPFNAKVGMTAAPAYRLTGLAIKPVSVDVTSGDATVDIELAVSSDSPLTSGSFGLMRPNLTSVAFLTFGTAQRYDGNDLNGSYRVSTTIARYSIPGTYTVESLELGNCIYGAGVGAPVTHAASGAGINFGLQVADSQPDTSPPQLTSVTLTPDPVNIHSGAQTITIDAAITDPITGLKRWVLTIYKPDGTQASNQFFFPPTPLSGTLNNGVFRATYEVPVGAPTGTWSLVITLVDNLHNTAVYGGATGLPFPHGTAEGTFEVEDFNDLFANRINLGSGTSITVTGTNVDAAMEPGETYTGTWGGRSVWWSWTAPSSGWTRIDTAGSGIDTVLGVFTGSNVASLTAVGWNVYAAWPATRSRLVFQAIAGTTYQIAVLGRFATSGGFHQGNLTLHVQTPVVPSVELTTMAPNPGSINVSSSSAVVNLTFQLAIPAGFQAGTCWLYTPAARPLNPVDFSSANRIAGNSFNGTYQLPVTIPAYAPPGEFLVELDVTDTADVGANYSNGNLAWGDHVQPSGDFTITVQNTGSIDAAPPTLTAISIAPKPLNVAAGSGTTFIDLTVTDPLSGFERGSLAIFKPNGVQHDYFHFDGATRISGNAKSGVYHVPLTLLDTDPLGLWVVAVGLDDFLGNGSWFDGSNMPGGAEAARFEVVATAGTDYAAWATGYFAAGEMATLGALDADPDADGTPNGIEAAAGTHPRQAASRCLTTAAMNQSGGSHLTLQFQRAESLPGDLVLAVQTNSDLASGTWTTLTQKTGSGPWSNPAIVTEGSPAAGRVAVTVHGPTGTASKQFMRLKVSR